MANQTNGKATDKENGIGFKHVYNLVYDSSTGDVEKAYTNWAESYEADSAKACYLAIFHTISEFCHALPENDIHQDCEIIDVGAGTGMGGEHLAKLGYKNIDALDLSPVMLEAAKAKGVYRNIVCAGLGMGAPEVNAMQYDAAFSSGCFTLGHFKASAVRELATIVRKGGIIAFNARQDTIETNAYDYRKCIEDLEEEKVWKILLRKKVDYYVYPNNDTRARYCHLFVCKRL